MKTLWTYSRRTVIAAVFLAFSLAIPGVVSASASAFETVIVFGDSLSDVGNSLLASSETAPVPVPFPSHFNRGRFSNGPVWVDYLAGRLASPAPADGFALPASIAIVAGSSGATTCPKAGLSCGYAFGGSGTRDAQTPTGIVPGLLSQVDLFNSELPGYGADPEALYVVWSGANNYLFPAFNEIFAPVAGGPIFGPLLAPDRPRAVVDDIVAAIDILTSLGARKFLVVNLPDLADVPLAAPPLASLVSEDVRDRLRARTLLHNQTLARSVRQLDRDGMAIGRDVVLLDAYTLLKLELASPGRRRAGPASGCLFPPGFGQPPCLPQNPLNFDQPLRTLIWDEQHPTTELHRILAQHAYEVLREFAGRPHRQAYRWPGRMRY